MKVSFEFDEDEWDDFFRGDDDIDEVKKKKKEEEEEKKRKKEKEDLLGMRFFPMNFQTNDRVRRQEEEDFREILLLLGRRAENQFCFDCGSPNPKWCSVSHGTWICIRCAGEHRCLGTHISFVRSAHLDSWKNEEFFNLMKVGGNERATRYFREKEILNFAFQAKYQSKEALEYREMLKREIKSGSQI